MKKEVIILIHGFKKQSKNDFEDFLELHNNKLNDYELVKLDYYDGNNLDTINHKHFDNVLIEQLEKYKDRKVKIISYSFGCILALNNISNYPNVNNILLIMPTLFINKWTWVKMFKEVKKKEKAIKERLGTERYERIAGKLVDKYFVEIAKTMDKYLSKNRNNISKVKDRNIKAIYTTNDEVSVVKKTIPFFKKNVVTNNNVELVEIQDSHFGYLEKEKTNNLISVLEFILN